MLFEGWFSDTNDPRNKTNEYEMLLVIVSDLSWYFMDRSGFQCPRHDRASEESSIRPLRDFLKISFRASSSL